MLRVVVMAFLTLLPAVGGADDVTLPAILAEARHGPTTIVEQPKGTPGIMGIIAWGIVIVPPAHRDARSFAEGGMVIDPPDPEDDIALALGTNERGTTPRRPPWLPRDLSLRFKRGADSFWSFVLPAL